MEYIKNADYDYIMNKYQDQSKPHNSSQRFVRRDEIFNESTGMFGDDIIEGIKRQDAEIKNLPHPVRKAKAFEYVLTNTRISCDNRDRFPAINMIDRPLNVLYWQWRKEIFEDTIPEIEKKRAEFESKGIATMWPDFDHSVPNWDRLFDLGFAGILKESEEARQRLAENKGLDEEQTAFFDGIKITYGAIIDFVGRLADLAEDTDGQQRMAKALKNIQYNPPATF